jgi:hypothetical protein
MPTLTADERAAREAANETDAQNHAALDPEALAEMDAADADAETEPEVTGADAEAAQQEARAELESWLDSQPDAEPEQEAEAGLCTLPAVTRVTTAAPPG